MGLLYWCVHNALRPENAAKLERLAIAPVHLVIGLLALSLLSLLLNGAKFWAVIRPIYPLRFWDVQAVNGIAGAASYAPAKLSIIARIIIHNRRDGVPILTIGAWMGSVAALLLAALVPLIGVAIWRKQVDILFVVVGVVGLVATGTVTVLLARIFAGVAGLARTQRIAARLPFVGRFTRTTAFAKLHVCFDMLADPATVALALSIRIFDLLVQAARFLVAANIVGLPITIDTAVIAACAFYVIGVVSPSGSLGARESGTTGLAALLAVPGFAPISLIVSGTEIIVNLTAALVGTLWLKPWRLVQSTKPTRP